jgi:hypothetical protein
MRQRPSWEADSSHIVKKIHHFLSKTMIHCINSSLPPVPNSNQMNPTTPQKRFPEIHFNIILLSTPSCYKWHLPCWLSNLISPDLVISPTHFIPLHMIIPIISDEEHKLSISSLCRFTHPPVTPPLLGLHKPPPYFTSSSRPISSWPSIIYIRSSTF